MRKAAASCSLRCWRSSGIVSNVATWPFSVGMPKIVPRPSRQVPGTSGAGGDDLGQGHGALGQVPAGQASGLLVEAVRPLGADPGQGLRGPVLDAGDELRGR